MNDPSTSSHVSNWVIGIGFLVGATLVSIRMIVALRNGTYTSNRCSYCYARLVRVRGLVYANVCKKCGRAQPRTIGRAS